MHNFLSWFRWQKLLKLHKNLEPLQESKRKTFQNFTYPRVHFEKKIPFNSYCYCTCEFVISTTDRVSIYVIINVCLFKIYEIFIKLLIPFFFVIIKLCYKLQNTFDKARIKDEKILLPFELCTSIAVSKCVLQMWGFSLEMNFFDPIVWTS